ncbi:DUF4177 domain-containing protein [Halogeometricum sp. S1BR25-6]|uniref:DUF4177 domain-containing protein n=1 Tax=Halogeometricum salsisoli TaxID=2950536 RepID=A0ABU2GGS7_9EURY|nr:DUF4177 domain-containing protein [Halogeometricum sp. S1BR25-6]MDS0300027.1 DUF4177 domain-containing protein [Halogeometricum sp. S1BR25-6]
MNRRRDDRWEYETLRVPREALKKESANPKDEINELAAEGWRLVETIDYTGGGTKFLIFERPARDSSDPDSE